MRSSFRIERDCNAREFLLPACGEKVAEGRMRGPSPCPLPASGERDLVNTYRKLFSTWSRYCFAFARAAGTSTVRTLRSRIRIFPSQIVVVTELPDAA